MKVRFVLFLLFITHLSYSQKSLLLNAHTDLGIPMNSYGNNKKMLAGRASSVDAQAGLSLTARLWNRIGITVGGAQNFQYWSIRDKAFEERYPGYETTISHSNFYYSLFGSLQFLQALSERTFLYGQVGYGFNFIGGGQLSQEKIFVIGNEKINADTKFSEQNNSIIPEIGIQRYLGDRHLLTFGLKWNMGRQNMAEGSYVSDNGTGNVFTDSYSSKGSSVGLTVKYSYVLAHKSKKEKQPTPPKHKEEESPVVKTPPVVKDNTQQKPPANPHIPSKVEGREVKVTHKVNVVSRKVKVKVWDHEQIDGDRISINLNGKWVLINYSLQKKVHEFEVELQPGVNYFVLHALNLGKYPPNTAAIIIDDGMKENKIVLESTLETSGTIEINVGSNR